jgi:hypothetical protein
MDRTPNGSVAWREQFREVAARLAEPAEALRQLLADIVGRALEAVGAGGGAVFVPDDDGRHLRAVVARGPGADALADLRLPLEASIAGYVFSSGTMMALGDLDEGQSPEYEAEVSRQNGVPTHTFLALPILHSGRAQGVATFVNRPGPPPHPPFQPAEMERAREYTVMEAAVLRHLQRLRQLAPYGAYDLAVAWAALDPAGPDQAATRPTANANLEPWARMLQHLERLSQEDQDFCADLVAFVARRRDWELG